MINCFSLLTILNNEKYVVNLFMNGDVLEIYNLLIQIIIDYYLLMNKINYYYY